MATAHKSRPRSQTLFHGLGTRLATCNSLLNIAEVRESGTETKHRSQAQRQQGGSMGVGLGWEHGGWEHGGWTGVEAWGVELGWGGSMGHRRVGLGGRWG